MNTPKDQFYRSARINQDPLWKFLLKAYMVPKYAKLFTNFILFPKSVFSRSTQTVVEFSKVSLLVIWYITQYPVGTKSDQPLSPAYC